MDIQEIKDFAAISAINAAVQAEMAIMEGLKAGNNLQSSICSPPIYLEGDFNRVAEKISELAKMLEGFS
jgi:hypothetical protein